MSILKISDEYEIENTSYYSGSYNDAIITGSMPNRGVVGRHTSGSNQIFAATRLSDFVYYFSQSNPSLSNQSIRFAQLMSAGEQYYDSLIPQIDDIIGINGGKLILINISNPTTPALSFRYIFGGFVPDGRFLSVSATINGSSSQISDDKWLYSFPFQMSYNNIKRVTSLNLDLRNKTFNVSGTYKNDGSMLIGGTTASISVTGTLQANAIDPFWQAFIGDVTATADIQLTYVRSGSISGSNSVMHFAIEDANGSVNLSTMAWSPDPPIAKPVLTNQNVVIKHLYGFGDTPSTNAVLEIGGPYTYVAGSRHRYGVGALLRGWKYGLYNGFPTNTKCIFRVGKYGQFRDMLEQRPYTKFFKTDEASSVTITEAAVSTKFVSGSNAYITSSNPTTYNARESGIYDFECKVGKPFFDL